MREAHLKVLDADDEQRLDPLFDRWWDSGEDVSECEIFKYQRVVQAFAEDRTLLPSFSAPPFLTSLPFNSTILAPVCRRCDCTASPDSLKPFLETGSVIPVLYSPYVAYPTKFVRMILERPHISYHEFSFFRQKAILEATRRCLCPHCLQLQRDRLSNYKSVRDLPEDSRKRLLEIVREIFGNLHPHAEHDQTLIDAVVAAVRFRRSSQLHQLRKVAAGIYSYRTYQAFGAELGIPYELLDQIRPYLDSAEAHELNNSLQLTRETALEGLGIVIPETGDVEPFLQILMDRRAAIRQVVNNLVSGDPDSASASHSMLYDRIAEINEDIYRVNHSLKHKLLNASVGFVNGNRGITAGVLMAAAFGIAGSVIGCGASLAAGVGFKIASKFKATVPPEFKK